MVLHHHVAAQKARVNGAHTPLFDCLFGFIDRPMYCLHVVLETLWQAFYPYNWCTGWVTWCNPLYQHEELIGQVVPHGRWGGSHGDALSTTFMCLMAWWSHAAHDYHMHATISLEILSHVWAGNIWDPLRPGQRHFSEASLAAHQWPCTTFWLTSRSISVE